MAKKPSFNFGASAKQKKTKAAKPKRPTAKGGGNKGNAWRSYVGGAPGHSSAPIPD